jgi:hypothetical protein
MKAALNSPGRPPSGGPKRRLQAAQPVARLLAADECDFPGEPGRRPGRAETDRCIIDIWNERSVALGLLALRGERGDVG